MTRQDIHSQRIERLRKQAIARYPELWKQITAEWQSDGADDCAWLVYSANYVLRTQHIRWAIDPLTLRWRVLEAEPVPIQRSLAPLSFVVLTHRHADHLDLDLLRRLNRLPILWIVPESLRPRLVAEAGLRRQLVEVARPGETLQIGPIRIAPFEGLHDEHLERMEGGGTPARHRGVPSLGLLVEFASKRWLFPGDTRTYAARRLPRFGDIDGLFAHLWLGRGSAQTADPPLRETFCRFCLELCSRRVMLTHLEEFGRRAADFWGEDQAEGVRRCLRELDHRVVVEKAKMGDRVLL
jgi:L-ascorbate metabolism protein UlaG (beta-lactamase superfamily)